MIDFLKNKFWILLSLVLVGIVLLGVLLLITGKKGKISFRSEVDGYQIKVTDLSQFSSHLSQVHFWGKNKIFTGNQKYLDIDIKNLEVVLTSIPQPFDKFLIKDGSVFSSWGIEAHDDTIKLLVYENIDYLNKYNKDLSSSFYLPLYRATYLITNSFANKKDEEVSKITDTIRNVSPFPIEVIKKDKLSFLKIVSNLLIKKVYAQYCQGNIRCGTNVTYGTCSDDGSACSNGTQCASGICNFDTVCEDNQNLTSCSSIYNTMINCNAHGGNPCAYGNGTGCTFDSSQCTWYQPPPPGATNTPTPTPTSAPGYTECYRCANAGWCERHDVIGTCDTNCDACPDVTPPPPPPAGNSPTGWLDNADCTIAPNQLWGWSGDPDDVSLPTDVNLYFDGPAGTGALYGLGSANTQSVNGTDAFTICDIISPGNSLCNICSTDWSQPQCKHRYFLALIPATVGGINLRDGNQHRVYAYGINLPGTSGGDAHLLGSPKTFTCAAGPTATPIPTATYTPIPTPTPSGMIEARAVRVDTATTCALGIYNSIDNLTGTSLSVNPPVPPGTQNQTGSYVNWTAPANSQYTLDAQPSNSNFSLYRACLRINGTPAPEALSATLPENGTITWDLAYVPPGAWLQAQGGDVYASGVIASLLPAGITPREFNLKSAADATGFPGVVTYGGSGYDFAIESSGADPNGRQLVSSTNWLASDSYSTTTDYYTQFYNRFGAPTTQNYSDPNGAKPACATNPCVFYVNGDMTIQNGYAWSVADTDHIVFLITGTLTIKDSVNLTPSGNGFVGFIAKGGITVTADVGKSYIQSDPAIEGVYITNGTFTSGESLHDGLRRFVGKGMFIANSFLLQRDLGTVAPNGHNQDTSADLFIYNPAFLVNMPQQMMAASVKWEEVAP